LAGSWKLSATQANVALQSVRKTQPALDALAKENATLDFTRRARRLAAEPSGGETVRAHMAVSDALAQFKTGALRPLHEDALSVAMDASIAEAFKQLGAVRSLIGDDPAMRQVLANTGKAMRVMREVDRGLDRARPCEVRHHLQRPGRAPRRGTNTRNRGSRRAAGVRTGQDPGEAQVMVTLRAL
jgi:hypothetical protein